MVSREELKVGSYVCFDDNAALNKKYLSLRWTRLRVTKISADDITYMVDDEQCEWNGMKWPLMGSFEMLSHFGDMKNAHFKHRLKK